MQSLIYDGSFDGFLCAVFDVYYYKFQNADICTGKGFNGNIFDQPHIVQTQKNNSERVWKSLEKKLSKDAQSQLYRTFLSELPGIENSLLQYIQYALKNDKDITKDFSHPAVLTITQTAKKVYREKHRMEAFVRFQKTADDLYFSIIEPDFNVLPIIAPHFESRYADQRWLIYDAKRKYGIYYDLQQTTEVQLNFNADVAKGNNIASVYTDDEEMYQQLWQQYFKSVNIAARKNTKLHIQHMPRRYWKFLPEKKTGLSLL
jgi:probable DNA metabolism protein